MCCHLTPCLMRALGCHSLKGKCFSPGLEHGVHCWIRTNSGARPIPPLSQPGELDVLVGRAGGKHFFIVPSPSEGAAGAHRVCDVYTVPIITLISKEIHMVSKRSQEAGAVECVSGVRRHHTECIFESWHRMLKCMLCWFVETVTLMNSSSIGSLECLVL